MIFFKPENVTPLNGQAVSAKITAFDGSNEIGSCTVTVDSFNCYLSTFSVLTGDDLLTEGLIRSALNFAANRGAYIAVCADLSVENTLKLLGFSLSDGKYKGEIPELLKGSCCKNTGNID